MMLLKIFFLSAIVSFGNILFAAEACKTEGESVGVYPGAPSCCNGLEAQSPAGLYGSATCVKKKSCIEEGGSVGVYPGAPVCCDGLEAQSPVSLYGSATCAKKKSCIEEGDSVGVYPGAPACCDGLEAQSSAGLYGGAICVKFQSPPSSNINDTRRDQKPRMNFDNFIDSSSNHSISR